MTEIENFYVVGLNYKKTDASIRGEFALNEDQYASLLQKARNENINNVFVLSTCNRTEIYGIVESPDELTDLLCSETTGSPEIFTSLSYTKNGREAVEHLFDVASGLDSQILGDYEIVGQLKQAVKFAKAQGNVGTFMERLSNTVFESSKIIKNHTFFSSGTVSVAFAAIQFLRLHCNNLTDKKIVLIGIGKIGKNMCKDLQDYSDAKNITLINRSADKAKVLAEELGLKFDDYANYRQQASDADVVIVATNAPQPILSKKDFLNNGKKILIDLSIPNNIDTDVKTRPQTILVNVDDLSKLNDETLYMREHEIPKVKKIIDEYIAEFTDWYEMHKNAPVIRAAKKTLTDIRLCPWYQSLQPEAMKTEKQQKDAVEKAVKELAVKMREHKTETLGCTYIEALHDFIARAPIKE